MKVARHLALLALVSAPAGAQSPEPVAVLSADSVRMAEVFELRVEIPVPPGSLVYFPDTIPATAEVESHEPVQWRARRGPDGGATLELTYALLAFGTGNVTLPRLDVLTMPLEDETAGESIRGGSRVGVWEERQPSIRYTRGVTPPDIWVEPVWTAEDIVAGMAPRGPDDVVGFSWSWPSIALVLLFSTVIVGAVTTSARGWLADRGEPAPTAAVPTSMDEARRRAIEVLDRLLAAGPYPPEQAQPLYSESSGVVRRFVERLDPEWGPELTSTELMRSLAARASDGDALTPEMRTAEAVKFGRLRPDPEHTTAHLTVLRSWFEGRAGGRA